MRRSRALSGPVAGLLGVAFTLPLAGLASAQGTSAGGAQELRLDEITVTARKIEESVMSVPIAITAFTAKDIEAQGIKQLNDVMLMTPSFNFVNQQGGSGRNDRSANALVFRGLYLSGNVGLTSGGQLFVDGAPVIGAQPPAIVDVERIEVLKGPQSAYFGRSTFAGAINFVTRDPGNEFKGKINAETSSFNSHDASMSFEGPIVADKLSGRITGRYFERGGQYNNAAFPGSDKLGSQTTGSLSGSLVFKPTDSLKIRSYVNWFRDNDGPPAQGALKAGQFNGRANADGSCTPFSQLAPGVAGNGQTAASRASYGYYCGTLPKVDNLGSIISGDYDTGNPVTSQALFNPNPNWLIFNPGFNTQGGIKRHALQADVRIDYDFAGYTLSALSAYHRDQTQTIIDLNYRDGHNLVNPNYSLATAATRLPWNQFLLLSQGFLRDWSQELRLTSPREQRLRWTFGGNYLSAHSPGGTVYGQTELGALFTAAITQQDVKTPAVFGAVYFDLTKQLTLSVEARYQWDKVTSTPVIGTSGLPVTGLAATALENTFKSFSPRVSLDYKYADNSTIYALYSRGYRPGGFNTGLVTSTAATLAALQAVVPNAGLTFDQEELDNIELGIKSTFLDGRARTTFTVYSDKWKNGQVANNVPVVVAGVANLIGLTVNNGTADLKGIEFEGQFRATHNLTLSATAAYNKSEIQSYGLGAGNCSDCNFVYGSFSGAIGRQLPTVPKVTWTASGEYTDRLNGSVDWYSRIDYQHQGSKYTDLSGVAQVGASDNVNARIGLRADKWTVEVFGTNLTQNTVMASALLGIDVFTFLPGLSPNKNEIRFSPPLPRMFGLRTSYNF